MAYELIYNSVSTQFEIDNEDLLAILRSSRRNNAALELTGRLLCHGTEFVQLLEGSQEAVRHMFYDVILRDPRHRAAHVSWEYTLPVRSFGDWGMGFARGRNPTCTLNEGCVLTDGWDQRGPSEPSSMGCRLLLAFHEQMAGYRGSLS